MNSLFLTLIDWQKYKPENLFGGQVLERTPAGLTIVYIIGVGILIGFLVLTFLDNFSRPRFIFEANLPKEITKRLTQTIANRSIRAWQALFVILALAVFGFQVYWVYFADETNQEFQALAYKDLRARRAGQGTLRPWILDRTGNLNAALADYKIGKNGRILEFGTAWAAVTVHRRRRPGPGALRGAGEAPAESAKGLRAAAGRRFRHTHPTGRS